jgi:hypothetical protein
MARFIDEHRFAQTLYFCWTRDWFSREQRVQQLICGYGNSGCQ